MPQPAHTEPREAPPATAGRVSRPLLPDLGHGLLALWILGTALVYFIRFTADFYRANQGAIDGLIERISS